MAAQYVNNVIPPQVVANGSYAALTLTTNNPLLTGLTAIPARVTVVITSIKVTNVSAALANFKLSVGAASGSPSELVPYTPIPLPVVGEPYTEILTAPLVAEAGQSFFAQSSVAAALEIRAEGLVIVQ